MTDFRRKLSDLAVPAALLGALLFTASRPPAPAASTAGGRYHAYLSEPVLRFSHRIGTLYG